MQTLNTLAKGVAGVPDFNLLSLIRMNFIDVCALYRKKLWQEVGGYDEQMPWMGLEDWDFWLRVASHGGSFFTFQRSDSISVRGQILWQCRVIGMPHN